MSKEEISAGYTAEWRNKTVNYQIPQFRKALVVGATPGNIGSSIARRFRKKGFYSVDELDNRGFDITNERDVTGQDWGEHDILVICTGFTDLEWFEKQDASMQRKVVETTLLGPIMLASEWAGDTMDRELIKYLVFIGSMAHRAVLNGSAAYCAAKAGIAHLVECLGYELTPKGYRVFGVNPSNTLNSPMSEATIEGLQNYRGLTRQQAEEYWSTGLLMPDFLTKREIAETVSWLVSGKADHLTGSNLDLKGGQR